MKTTASADFMLTARRAYSADEVAAALGMSVSTVWKYIGLGKLQAVRLGGRTVVSADELDRVLSQGF